MVSIILALALQANPHLPKAIEQVRALDETAALATLELAKRWPENTPSELAQVHLWFGLAYVGLAREAEARESFREALALDEALELPSGTSPVVVGWWKALGGRTAKPKLVPDEVVGGQPLLVKPVEPLPPPRWKPWTAVAISAAAITTLGVGVYFGVQSRQLRASAENTEPAGVADALNQEAIVSAQRANWCFGFGGAGALAGAALFVF